ncbi:MAG: hypothetical protein M3Y72_06220 [Acidobacteriota bacterium]|nr:hypothetical protein [Acidobacteriota bacterium]
MSSYSGATRVEPTWLGWLSIAQAHYEAAIEGTNKQTSQRMARKAVREAKSMFPNPKRFAAAANTGASGPLRKHG